MFEITVRRSFSAAHAIVMRGVRESMHGHDWGVTATVSGDSLDPDGLLCDFHALERTVEDAVAPFHNRTLNDVPPFDRVNPTAENVAEFVAIEVAARLPVGLTVRRVEVREAPECTATWIAGADASVSPAPMVESRPVIAPTNDELAREIAGTPASGSPPVQRRSQRG